MSLSSSALWKDDTSPLAGRHALVTGGARGIGAAVARELARLGAVLTITGRTSAALDERRAELLEGGASEVRMVVMDVTDAPSVARAFVEARSALGPPLILVNNAGAAESASFQRTDPSLWQRMLDANVGGAYACTRAALPEMIEAGWGRVVNVASTAGLRGYPYAVAYCAAKHALVGLTRALAVEIARSGVTVNAVCPGYTETDLLANAAGEIVAKTGRSLESVRTELQKVNPQGRFVRADEVAAAVSWLCLPSSGAVTGVALPVAGGEHA